ncbi:hypothetical protein [Pseudoalteromonas luteoviolacea]|uniref:Uncharacterized protein n=1 Tax=Pseudoalteromonas luteoviolacea S4054 TaxID=1129367 RepID=A0A0F6AAS9_9GAMM|nr:hypothetical protein [Pseudoalteromonas luteoviolacea]AOT09070.1 hypothetical protein S4054249_14935 [Pseudoalteromonas luteoviolacea]AOT13982.1 hypothetical protein S40542_14905 [Pseudoalteromonas luteoviolacea]AOT18897.1 hypothetical protein S4054_14910 [Pseudoalteromonas luteoviolacea]KKE83263.1 hypothetical protein N479_14800 [Pseudoalteromonas luteoviolacea S4054]KZN73206.1 hypothetical protein N481_12840 [Pseudoalteromonas luteoviolacea S4047-1]
MLRLSGVIAVLASGLFLGACSEPSERINLAQFKERVQALNWFMLDNTIASAEKVMPYDELYLFRRNSLLNTLDQSQIAPNDKDTLAYLTIQQRYPERYLGWPMQSNIAKKALEHFNYQQVDAWLNRTQKRLESARDSNILISRIEKEQLLAYLAETKHQSDEKEALTVFLQQYNTRSGIGLSQLPNGTEWYQSKLNYYLGHVSTPHDLTRLLNAVKADVPKNISPNKQLLTSSVQPAALMLLDEGCEHAPGLNWRDHFIDIRKTVAQCQLSIDKDTLKIAAIVAEVDLGVHAFSWSQQQAMHRLQTRLNLNEAQAYALLKSIVFYPATILVFLEQLKLQ